MIEEGIWQGSELGSWEERDFTSDFTVIMIIIDDMI
jgi:hypothetical protein